MQICRSKATNRQKSRCPHSNSPKINTDIQEDQGYNILKNYGGLSAQKKVMGKKVQKNPILAVFWQFFVQKIRCPQLNSTKIEADIQEHQGYNIQKNFGGLSFQKKVMGK